MPHPARTTRCLQGRPPRRRASRGMGLLEGLVAVMILCFGLLGLMRFQLGMVSRSTEAQGRMQASQLADELLSTVLVDASNAGCYVLPTPSNCNSAAASARAADWRTRALAALPGEDEATSTLDAGSARFTVTLRWTGKGTQDSHVLQVATDAR